MTEKQFDRTIGIAGLVVIIGLFIGVSVLRRNRFDDRYGHAMQEYRAEYATWKERKRMAGEKFRETNDDGGDYFVWKQEYNRNNRFTAPFPKRRDYK